MPNNVDLEQPARILASHVKGTLLSQNIVQFVVGYHLRHVLDLKAPTVGLEASSDKLKASAMDAHGCLDRLGLHSLNHVVDLLYYSSPNDRRPIPEGKPLLIVARLTFEMASGESRHHFDDEEYVESFAVWESLPKGQKAEHEEIASLLAKDPEDFVFVRMGVLSASAQERFKNLKVKSTADILTLGALFDDPEFVFNHYVCGAQKLCHRLRVQPNLLAYRSLIAAIVQLGAFLGVGSEVVSVLVRPSHPWSVVHGVTVVSREVVPTTVVGILVQLMENMEDGRHMEDLRTSLRRFEGLKLYDEPHRHSTVVSVTNAMVTHLGDDLLKSCPYLQNPEKVFKRSFASFLRIAMTFCEEHNEGRPLRYGLLLGNARLMQFWPGPAPVPVRQGERFLSLDYLPDMFHLVENPAARALVIPYVSSLTTGDDEATTWVVELPHFREALSTFVDGMPWGEDLLPYVYFSQVYPWCIACVVGPGAEMRIFVRGELLAYRDGKGWRCANTRWFNPHCPARTALVRLALQLSPIARSGSHGSLLVYVAEAKEGFWDSEKNEKNLVPLTEVEPMIRKGDPGQPDERWLTGRSLLKQGNGQYDRVVFERLVRAGSLDGAIVLEGKDCKIARFAQQLGYRENTGGEGGTKRATARAFVKTMRDRPDVVDKTAYAVAISSDGPIRFVEWDEGSRDVRMEDVFQAIEE